jgi:AcrR family transcriptional regulator
VTTPPLLNREIVVDRAVAVADREGLDAVTFRRLADELGVTPMALYWHVKSKDELLGAMGDRLFEGLAPKRREGVEWSEELGELAQSLTRALAAHPALAVLAAPQVLHNEDGRQLTERALELLRGAGFSIEQAAEIARHVLSAAVALVVEESTLEVSGMPQADEVWQAKRVALQALPSERYPRLVEAAVALTACADSASYYKLGIDLLVAGVVAMQPALT